MKTKNLMIMGLLFIIIVIGVTVPFGYLTYMNSLDNFDITQAPDNYIIDDIINEIDLIEETDLIDDSWVGTIESEFPIAPNWKYNIHHSLIVYDEITNVLKIKTRISCIIDFEFSDYSFNQDPNTNIINYGIIGDEMYSHSISIEYRWFELDYKIYQILLSSYYLVIVDDDNSVVYADISMRFELIQAPM